MRRSVFRVGLLVQVLAAFAGAWAAGAAAEPGTGPRETVDQTFTTTRPGSPTGLGFSAGYHAAGDPQGNPPYLRRMVIHPADGMRYDTSVPERCSASDAELQLRGPAACPPRSWLGGGTIEGLIIEPFAHDFTFDHFVHHIDILNNTNEQIVLVQSEGWTVVRSEIRPDGSIELNVPSCFPVPPAGGCADDYVLELSSSSMLAPYTRRSGDRLLSYATTPPRCPASGYWRTTVEHWWSDGSTDSVVTRQPCTKKKGHSKKHHRKKHHRR